MPNFKSIFKKIKKSHIQVVGVLLIIALAAALVWYGNANSKQSVSTTAAQIRFDGEYRIADGEWQTIEEGKHIPTPKGDVTLRLNFRLMTPDGEPMDNFKGTVPIAFYTHHIGITCYYDGNKTYISDNENPMIGESACGENWSVYPVTVGSGIPTEIVVHNPHIFGNETAIDEMLSGVAVFGSTIFEKEILAEGEPQRNAGILLMLVSVVFLGIALFSSLIHIKNTRVIWLLGLVVLSAGAYVAFDAKGVSFWSDSVVTNTTMLGISMMFYMLFLSMISACLLKTTKRVANITLLILSGVDAAFILTPILSDVYFYDTWLWWICVQAVANAVLTVCFIKEFITLKAKTRWVYLAAILPLVSFVTDAVGTWLGGWRGGVASSYAFIVLFAATVVIVLQLIPRNINAANKAKELEMEKIVLNAQLTESRISTMMSQIRPHFIYNTLGTIEQLCKIDPPKAADLVHNFAKYLRGNFGELDNPKPILMSQEMEHVHHYISIENVRFPDMTFTFEMRSSDFKIPALTVQPIVENVIKHGLMKLPKGGTIRVVSYETDTHYCVSVEDNGVGFDTATLFEDRKHVGLRNIRERLKVMVNGTLEIESTVGVGTKVLIKIPKEVTE
ncbi:MAG: histidine kinase [Clostridia bacterium]|nr:histidine kinase [Clostridia bacterium]